MWHWQCLIGGTEESLSLQNNHRCGKRHPGYHEVLRKDAVGNNSPFYGRDLNFSVEKLEMWRDLVERSESSIG